MTAAPAKTESAWKAGQSKFSMTVQACHYQQLPVSQYRVYCLEKLRERYSALSTSDQGSVKALLPFPDAAVLWQEDVRVKSGYDEAQEAPFNRAINVFDGAVPS